MKQITHVCDCCHENINCTPVSLKMGHPSFSVHKGWYALDLCYKCWASVEALLIRQGFKQ